MIEHAYGVWLRALIKNVKVNARSRWLCNASDGGVSGRERITRMRWHPPPMEVTGRRRDSWK